MKLAVVVQRYGPSINGGAELHARYVAEHLARHVDVEVLTTCATDYVTWRNELRPGADVVNGVTVRRFPVKYERDPHDFGRRSERVFKTVHSLSDELAWLRAEGPMVPSLVDHLKDHSQNYDFCIFFSYRYYHAFHGIRATSSRAVLVPTAERDEAIGLAMFQPIFRGVRALMYNSQEERAMIRAVSGNESVPGVVVGVGSEIAGNPQPGRFRQKYDLPGPFALYIGRVDRNKGCEELFQLFQSYLRDAQGELSLVLIGHSLLEVPKHPRIRALGMLDDLDKFDALAAADVLIMPSYFESLSMVILEAWALGRPVIVNGRCDVLKGQCLRSNAGLYYDNPIEFIETLRAIERHRWLSAALGRNGRHFFREHYDWPVIERKYLDMFGRLSREPGATAIGALPGWFERRHRNLAPAAEVLARLPQGTAPIDHSDQAPRREVQPAPIAEFPARADGPHARPFHSRQERGRPHRRGGRGR